MSRLLLSLLSLVLLPCFALAQTDAGPLANIHPRPQVSYLHTSGGAFTVTPQTRIVIADDAGAGQQPAIAYLQRALIAAAGSPLSVVSAKNYDNTGNVIFLGDTGSYPALDNELRRTMPAGEVLHGDESYVIDIQQGRALLAAPHSKGLYYACVTLAALLQSPTTHATIPALHILDWPDYPNRWVFSMHNLQVAANIDVLAKIEDTMSAHKLNGLQQNDFKYNVLDRVPSWYWTDADSLKRYSLRSNIEIIPGVAPIGYSEGILWHDPNLVEGFPTQSRYVIEGDSGRLLSDPKTQLANGGFELQQNGQFTKFNYYDDPKTKMFVDSSVVHSGRYSARGTNFANGNCRFITTLPCEPHRSYHMSCWIKTQGFSGMYQMLAIGSDANGKSYTLAAPQNSVPATSNGWIQYHLVVNTQNCVSMNVYNGVWSGSAGAIWIDDWKIEDAGIACVLRRSESMPYLTNPHTSISYVEGVDYDTILDPALSQNLTYAWRGSPRFGVNAGSKLHTGDTIDVHFERPLPTLTDQDGGGQAMICPSEPKVYDILHQQIFQVDTLYHPAQYFLGHDEIRVMNQDSACLRRGLTPAQLLADNFNKCDSITKRIAPGAHTYVWSDMFDSLHNAHPAYYLVNGDLTGSWDLIPKSVTIMNWNSTYMRQSLDFFARHGFSQMSSPYYDQGNVANIRDWRVAMDGVPNALGMMYTTWSADYRFLTPFADYAWSAGPMLIHEPLDSATVARFAGNTLSLTAIALADPYYAQDQIQSVRVAYSYSVGSNVLWDTLAMPSKGGGVYAIDISHQPTAYFITVRNTEGLRRTSPTYQYVTSSSQGVSEEVANRRLGVFPNPASRYCDVAPPSGEGACEVTLVNAVGRVVYAVTNPSAAVIRIPLEGIPAGTYECVVKRGALVQRERLSVIR